MKTSILCLMLSLLVISTRAQVDKLLKDITASGKIFLDGCSSIAKPANQLNSYETHSNVQCLSYVDGVFETMSKGDDCVQKLSERIQVGTSQGDVELLLDQCGFTHSFDQKTSMIYGLKHGEKSALTRQDWSAQIKLDEGRKVTSAKVEKVFTGP